MIEMELEFNPETGEYFVIIPESMLESLGWDESDMLEYSIEDEILTIYRI